MAEPDRELLIRALMADADPVEPLEPPWRRAGVWLAAACLLGLVMAILGNPAGALERLTGAPDAWVAELGAGLTAVAAELAALASAVPGRSRHWPWAIAPGLVLWIGASGVGCLRSWVVPGMVATTDLAESRQCLIFILGMSVPLSAAMIFLLRRAAPLRPGLSAALAGLACAAAAATMLGFFHEFDASWTDLAVHAAAVGLVVLANRVLGGRLLAAA